MNIRTQLLILYILAGAVMAGLWIFSKLITGGF